MFSGKGDKPSRQGSSLLGFADKPASSRRAAADPRQMLDQIALPDMFADNAAERHRRARARRERTDNPYLSELANRPQDATDNGPEADQPIRQFAAAHARQASAPQLARPSVLDQFEEIDAAARNRSREEFSRPNSDAGAPGFENRPHPPVNSSPAEWRPLIEPAFILAAIRKWRPLIISAGIVGAALGVMLALTTPKLFYATAELSIDPRGLKVIDNGVNPDGFLSDAFAVVDSQVRVVTSPAVLEQVVKDLSLDKDIEFNGTLKKGWLDSLSAIFSRQDADNDQARAAAEYLGAHVYVDRGAKTFVINVTSSSEDPQKAALIANKVVEVYIAEQRSQQSETVRQTTGELTKRLSALKSEVEKAEQKVEAYKAENDLVGAGGRMIDDEAILRVNDQLSAAKGQTIALNARAKSIRGVTPDSVVQGGLAEELNSTVLSALRSQYSTAKQKRDGLATKLGPRHPERILAESELDSLRQSIAAEIARVAASMQSDLKRAVQTEQDLAARLAELKVGQGNSGEGQVKLRELQREADASRSVYEAFLLRARQTGEQIDLNTADIKVIVPAQPPRTPEGASRKLIILGGLLAGLFFGLALAILKGIADSIGNASSNGQSRPAPKPFEPEPSGGMFRPRQRRGHGEAARETFPAGRTASAIVAELREDPEPGYQRFENEASVGVTAVPPHAPQPFAQPPASSPNVHQTAPAMALPQSVHPHSVQQWALQPQLQQTQAMVPPGPMIYPQQIFQPQQVFHPQPAFVPQLVAVQSWQPMAAPLPVPQPVQVQMPALEPHPFANESAQFRPFRHQPAPPPFAAADHRSAGAGDNPRIDEIRESIEEFRAALNDLAARRRA